MEVSVDGVVLPVGQFLLDKLDREFRLQSQRIAAQVNRCESVFRQWKIECVAETRELVMRIQLCCKFARIFKLQWSVPFGHDGAALIAGPVFFGAVKTLEDRRQLPDNVIDVDILFVQLVCAVITEPHEAVELM